MTEEVSSPSCELKILDLVLSSNEDQALMIMSNIHFLYRNGLENWLEHYESHKRYLKRKKKDALLAKKAERSAKQHGLFTAPADSYSDLKVKREAQHAFEAHEVLEAQVHMLIEQLFDKFDEEGEQQTGGREDVVRHTKHDRWIRKFVKTDHLIALFTEHVNIVHALMERLEGILFTFEDMPEADKEPGSHAYNEFIHKHNKILVEVLQLLKHTARVKKLKPLLGSPEVNLIPLLCSLLNTFTEVGDTIINSILTILQNLMKYVSLAPARGMAVGTSLHDNSAYFSSHDGEAVVKALLRVCYDHVMYDSDMQLRSFACLQELASKSEENRIWLVYQHREKRWQRHLKRERLRLAGKEGSKPIGNGSNGYNNGDDGSGVPENIDGQSSKVGVKGISNLSKDINRRSGYGSGPRVKQREIFSQRRTRIGRKTAKGLLKTSELHGIQEGEEGDPEDYDEDVYSTESWGTGRAAVIQAIHAPIVVNLANADLLMTMAGVLNNFIVGKLVRSQKANMLFTFDIINTLTECEDCCSGMFMSPLLLPLLKIIDYSPDSDQSGRGMQILHKMVNHRDGGMTLKHLLFTFDMDSEATSCETNTSTNSIDGGGAPVPQTSVHVLPILVRQIRYGTLLGKVHALLVLEQLTIAVSATNIPTSFMSSDDGSSRKSGTAAGGGHTGTSHRRPSVQLGTPSSASANKQTFALGDKGRLEERGVLFDLIAKQTDEQKVSDLLNNRSWYSTEAVYSQSIELVRNLLKPSLGVCFELIRHLRLYHHLNPHGNLGKSIDSSDLHYHSNDNHTAPSRDGIFKNANITSTGIRSSCLRMLSYLAVAIRDGHHPLLREDNSMLFGSSVHVFSHAHSALNDSTGNFLAPYPCRGDGMFHHLDNDEEEDYEDDWDAEDDNENEREGERTTIRPSLVAGKRKSTVKHSHDHTAFVKSFLGLFDGYRGFTSRTEDVAAAHSSLWYYSHQKAGDNNAKDGKVTSDSNNQNNIHNDPSVVVKKREAMGEEEIEALRLLSTLVTDLRAFKQLCRWRVLFRAFTYLYQSDNMYVFSLEGTADILIINTLLNVLSSCAYLGCDHELYDNDPELQTGEVDISTTLVSTRVRELNLGPHIAHKLLNTPPDTSAALMKTKLFALFFILEGYRPEGVPSRLLHYKHSTSTMNTSNTSATKNTNANNSDPSTLSASDLSLLKQYEAECTFVLDDLLSTAQALTLAHKDESRDARLDAFAATFIQSQPIVVSLGSSGDDGVLQGQQVIPHPMYTFSPYICSYQSYQVGQAASVKGVLLPQWRDEDKEEEKQIDVIVAGHTRSNFFAPSTSLSKTPAMRSTTVASSSSSSSSSTSSMFNKFDRASDGIRSTDKNDSSSKQSRARLQQRFYLPDKATMESCGYGMSLQSLLTAICNVSKGGHYLKSTLQTRHVITLIDLFSYCCNIARLHVDTSSKSISMTGNESNSEANGHGHGGHIKRYTGHKHDSFILEVASNDNNGNGKLTINKGKTKEMFSSLLNIKNQHLVDALGLDVASARTCMELIVDTLLHLSIAHITISPHEMYADWFPAQKHREKYNLFYRQLLVFEHACSFKMHQKQVLGAVDMVYSESQYRKSLALRKALLQCKIDSDWLLKSEKEEKERLWRVPRDALEIPTADVQPRISIQDLLTNDSSIKQIHERDKGDMMEPVAEQTEQTEPAAAQARQAMPPQIHITFSYSRHPRANPQYVTAFAEKLRHYHTQVQPDTPLTSPSTRQNPSSKHNQNKNNEDNSNEIAELLVWTYDEGTPHIPATLPYKSKYQENERHSSLTHRDVREAEKAVEAISQRDDGEGGYKQRLLPGSDVEISPLYVVDNAASLYMDSKNGKKKATSGSKEGDDYDQDWEDEEAGESEEAIDDTVPEGTNGVQGNGNNNDGNDEYDADPGVREEEDDQIHSKAQAMLAEQTVRGPSEEDVYSYIDPILVKSLDSQVDQLLHVRDPIFASMDLSQVIIIFISKEYAEDSLCRLEAAHAVRLAQKGYARVLFVMTQYKYNLLHQTSDTKHFFLPESLHPHRACPHYKKATMETDATRYVHIRPQSMRAHAHRRQGVNQEKKGNGHDGITSSDEFDGLLHLNIEDFVSHSPCEGINNWLYQLMGGLDFAGSSASKSKNIGDINDSMWYALWSPTHLQYLLSYLVPAINDEATFERCILPESNYRPPGANRAK